MKKIFIMEILCIYAKRGFFARIFEMYCHFIISGENESEEWEIGEEEREAIEREEENIQQVRSQFRIDQTCQMKGKPNEGLAPLPRLICPVYYLCLRWHWRKSVINGPTDGSTDGPTDRRTASSQLKGDSRVNAPLYTHLGLQEGRPGPPEKKKEKQ